MKKLSMNNSSARDSRINELERLLVQKQAQIEEVHRDVQDVQQAISSRDGCYRKLEYEMRLLSSGLEDDPWRALKRSTDAVQQHLFRCLPIDRESGCTLILTLLKKQPKRRSDLESC